MPGDINIVLVAPDGTHSLVTADGPIRVRMATANWTEGDRSLLDEADGLAEPVPFRSVEEIRRQVELVRGSSHAMADDVLRHLTSSATFLETDEG